jgi:hypothetical protein
VESTGLVIMFQPVLDEICAMHLLSWAPAPTVGSSKLNLSRFQNHAEPFHILLDQRWLQDAMFSSLKFRNSNRPSNSKYVFFNNNDATYCMETKHNM